jgi:superfamily II RNA helicase
VEFRGLQLDGFQEEAITHVQNHRSVLVSAPTGTGKTLIADYIVEQSLKEERDVIYTAPIKALSNQKYRDYTRLYGHSAVGLITGDLVINRDASLRIMTTEILRNMLLSGDDLSSLAYVIIDEIHFLDDPERGTVWEEVLIYLPPSVKILGLSATLANIREFSDWLAYVRNEEVPVVIEEERSVPLSIYLANRDAGVCDLDRYSYLHTKWTKMAEQAMADQRRKEASQRRAEGRSRRRGRPKKLWLPGTKETRHSELVQMLGPEFRPILYFAFSRKMCEGFARELARRAPDEGFTSDEEKVLIKQRVDIFDEEFKKVMTTEQEEMFIKGVAFHHAGAHVALKAFVEELYERKLVKVLYCTSTFALGINMPARAVIFQALRKYNGHQVVPLTVRQFMQKAGRAGRRGIDNVGYVVILEEFGDFERDEEAIRAYIRGDHEPVRSSFNLSYNSVANLLERHNRDLDAIRTITDKSFLNFHFLQKAKHEQERMDAIAEKLKEDGFDPNDPKAGGPPRHLASRAKKWRRIKRTHGKSADRVWKDFLEKKQVLHDIGYIEPNLEFNAGGRVLTHMQIEEIFSTELVLSGLLDTLEPQLLFGALCALSNSFSRTVTVRQRPRGEQAKMARAMRQIRFGDAVRTTEKALGVPVTFTPEMIPFGVAWFEGKSLNDIGLWVESATDISGDLVSAFRRAKDLSMQLRRVYGEDEYMLGKLREVAKTVTRDEVEVLD